MKGALAAAALALSTTLCGCVATRGASQPTPSPAAAPQASLVVPRYPLSAAAIPGAIEIATVGAKRDPVLARAAHHWLLAQMDGFAQAYLGDALRIAALPPRSPWHQIERAWIAWFNEVLPRLSDQELDRVEETVFGSAAPLRFDHAAFPGFDRFLFGLHRVEHWRAAGGPASSERFNSWLAFAGEVATDRNRLAAVLVERNDKLMTTELSFVLRPDALVDLLDHLGGRPELFEQAALALDMSMYRMQPSAVVKLFAHVWAAHPTERGHLLYLFALRDLRVDPWRYPDGTMYWTHFRQFFAGGATRADLADYFARGGWFAAPASRWLFPARADSASFVDLLVPRLDGWLDGNGPTHGKVDAEPGHGLEIVVRLVCEDHDETGMALLRAYFARRAVAHPDSDMVHFMDEWRPGSCAR